jgi:hypothetical protein
MTLPAESPAVVILDVMNLRDRWSGSEDNGGGKDGPFRIRHFDEYVSEIQRVLPGVVILGIVDGTAAYKGWRKVYGSKDDREELLGRTELGLTHPKYLHLLPPKASRWREDLKYLKADPVCVHLLSKFSSNGALITSDLMSKPEDLSWFPSDHLLRSSIFAPFWLRSEQSWVFLSRTNISTFPAWDGFFFSAVERGEVLRVEDCLRSTSLTELELEKVRERAYGYVHDLVTEHRAAGNRIVPLVLEWQKPRSAFDVLNPKDFVGVPAAPIEFVDDELINVGGSNDSDVLVRVDTEQIDLIRSINELQIYTGKRIAVQAMLQIDGEIPYLTWLGRSSRVKVILWSASAVIKSGFVRLEGVLTSDDGELTISVASANDLRYPSVGDAVSARLARLVKRDIYVGNKGSWTFPRLPRRPSRQSPPSTPPKVIDEPDTPIDDEAGGGPRISHTDAGSDVKNGSTKTTVPTGGSDSETTKGRSETEPSVVKPDTDLPARRTKWRMLAWIATACVVAAVVWFVLQTYVFAFEIPDPAVCANLEPEACEAIVTEWQGDALRIHLYGTRGADGVVR